MSAVWWQGITQRNIAKMLVLKNKEIPACLVVLDVVDLASLLMLSGLDTPPTFMTGNGSLFCSPLFNIDVARLLYLNPLLFSLHTLIQFDVFVLHLHICALASSSSFYPVIRSYQSKSRLYTSPWQNWYTKKQDPAPSAPSTLTLPVVRPSSETGKSFLTHPSPTYHSSSLSPGHGNYIFRVFLECLCSSVYLLLTKSGPHHLLPQQVQ